MTKALEAAKEDLPRAITILEKSQGAAPDDRDALYLLGAMTTVRGETSDDPAERLAMFRKSTDAFVRLQKDHKDLKNHEKAFLTRSRIGEACVLAAEGKAEQSLGVIAQLMASGFDDIDALNGSPELESVRKLPAFKAAIESALRPGIVKELESFEPFPFDFALKDLGGEVIRLADYRGKVTIVDIWGTWCPPCRQEVPHFVDLYRQYRTRGLEVVGINAEEVGSAAEIEAKIRKFGAETGISYKCLLNDGQTEARIRGFQGYPTTLFIDRSGTVRLMQAGYSSKARLELIVTTLLAETSKPDNRAEGSR